MTKESYVISALWNQDGPWCEKCGAPILDGRTSFVRALQSVVAERDALRAVILNGRTETWIDTNEVAVVFDEDAYRELCAALGSA